jgi:hypothetical protein
MPRPARTAQRRFIAIAAPATLVVGILGAGSAAAVPTQLTSTATAATAAIAATEATAATPATPATAATVRPKVPKLAWKGCFNEFQCAKAKVPLDYSKPRGRTITIALIRLRATDRAHRIGQARHVFAYRLIAKDTVEEKVAELQQSKRDLAEAILSADAGLIRDLKPEDVEWLLS